MDRPGTPGVGGSRGHHVVLRRGARGRRSPGRALRRARAARPPATGGGLGGQPARRVERAPRAAADRARRHDPPDVGLGRHRRGPRRPGRRARGAGRQGVRRGGAARAVDGAGRRRPGRVAPRRRSASASTRSAAARARSPWRRRCGRGSWSVWRGPSSARGSPKAGSSRRGSTSRARRCTARCASWATTRSRRRSRSIAEIQAHPGSAHEHPLLGRNIPMVWEIRGGQPLNVVPDACSVHLDWRVTPGGPSSAELFDWLVEAAARVDGDVEVVEVVEPFETQPDAVLAEALAGAVRRTTGATPAATGMIAWTDAHNFVDHGGSQAVVFGPGHLRNAHRPDEFVSLTDVVTCARSLAALIADTAAWARGRRMSARYDAVIVGGGHNGLVAAFYLARGGLRTLVLERRDIVGGACVTEEFAPGFRASPGAYVLSMLRDAIWRDMRLRERGLHVDQAGPSLNVFPDGQTFVLHGDRARSVDAIRPLSPHDARAFPAYEATLERIAVGADAGVRLDGARPAGAEPAGSARPPAARPARVPATSRPAGGVVPVHDVGEAVPGRALRRRDGEVGAGVGVDQQHARRSVHARDRVRPAARGGVGWLGRRRRVGVRARRHGHGDGADGGRRARGRCRDQDGRRGGAGADRRRPRHRCRARRRRGGRGGARAVQRGPQAHVPRLGRAGASPVRVRRLPGRVSLRGREHEDQPRRRRAAARPRCRR